MYKLESFVTDKINLTLTYTKKLLRQFLSWGKKRKESYLQITIIIVYNLTNTVS